MQPPAIPYEPDRPTMIVSSLGCFVWGLLSLVPVAGMGFAIHAFFLYRQASRAAPNAWNPAGRHLRVGYAATLLGFLLSLAEIGLACWLSGLGEFFVD